jgi:hypothetical protein
MIRKNNKNIHLGYFPTMELAAVAYERAAQKLFGEFAQLSVLREALPGDGIEVARIPFNRFAINGPMRESITIDMNSAKARKNSNQ